jgi:hypothetical protein
LNWEKQMTEVLPRDGIVYVKKFGSGAKSPALVAAIPPLIVARLIEDLAPDVLTRKVKAASRSGGELPRIPLGAIFELEVNSSGKLTSLNVAILPDPPRRGNGSVKLSHNRNPKGWYQVALSYDRIEETNGRALREDLSRWTPVKVCKTGIEFSRTERS